MSTIANRSYSAFLMLAILLGCGGGSESAPTGLQLSSSTPATFTCAAPPEGVTAAVGPTVMGGTIAGRHDPSFILVSRGDGSLPMLFYGPDLVATPSVAGVIIAQYNGRSCSSPDPTPYNGADRGRQSKASVYLHATGAPGVSLSGTIRYASATYSLTGGPVPGTTYNVAVPATIADAAGTWQMTDAFGAPMTFSVDANGAVAGNHRGCSLAGTVASSQEGLNLLQLRVNVSSCPSSVLYLPGAYEGFALALPMSSGGTQLLVWAEANNGIDFDYVLGMGRR